jgi:hypothetical protein
MATSTGKSVYNDLITDVRNDINEEDELASLSNEQIQYWILEAEKQVCDKVRITDKYILGINASVVKYYYQDRPVVTGCTAATPIVVTSASHGLSVGDIISLQEIQGVDGANGQRYISAKDTNTFTIQILDYVLNATNASPIVINSPNHGLTTGTTIVIEGVTGNLAANGTFVITVVDVNNFSLNGSTGNGVYLSGGIIHTNTIGSGTYTAGGRYWKDDEIPTYFKKFIRGDRSWGTIKRQIRICDMLELRNKDREISEMYGIWDDYDSPMLMARWNEGFQQYEEIYPFPRSDQNITLYGQVKITPKDYEIGRAHV